MLLSLLSSTSIARLLMPVAVQLLLLTLLTSSSQGAEPTGDGVSSREARLQAIQSVPFKQMSSNTSQALRDVLDNPSFYRRMPSQTIQCDPELFSFLVRKPEVMVNTWDLMGITKVTAKRTGPYSFLANDGVGTKCKCDLVYGDDKIHIYYGVGDYDGSLTARTIKGRAVCILRSQAQLDPQAHSGHQVRGTMDVFLKLDNLGADLLTRTFGPLVAKTADHNFAETAQFVAQLSQICANNPPAAQGLAAQLQNIDEPVRQEFSTIATRIAENSQIAKRVPSGIAVADPAIMAQTIQELKIASNLSSSAQAADNGPTAMNPPKLTSAATKTEPFAKVPPMHSNLSDSYSGRRQSTNAAAEQPLQSSATKLDSGPLPPSALQPKKTGVTMRR